MNRRAVIFVILLTVVLAACRLRHNDYSDFRTFDDAEAHVTIVHVPKRKRFSDTSTGKALDRLGEYCRKNFHHYHFKTVPLNGNVDIEEFAALQAEFKFDLIAVPNRRRNAFSRLFNPGLAHKILFQTDIPMLVIPV